MRELVRIRYNEEWKVWVSTDGKIYRKFGENQFAEYSQSLTNSGYYQVGFPKDNKPCCRLVHRLVAETFLNNPNNLRDVDHINNIRTDNRLSNLRFCTHGFNCARASSPLSEERLAAMVDGAKKHHMGKKWFTDGVKNILAAEDDCPQGFHLGFTKSCKGQGHYKVKPARECLHEEKFA